MPISIVMVSICILKTSKFTYVYLYFKEFVEARRTPGLNNAPSCLWSPLPPRELKGASEEALSANAGFVTFGRN